MIPHVAKRGGRLQLMSIEAGRLSIAQTVDIGQMVGASISSFIRSSRFVPPAMNRAFGFEKADCAAASMDEARFLWMTGLTPLVRSFGATASSRAARRSVSTAERSAASSPSISASQIAFGYAGSPGRTSPRPPIVRRISSAFVEVTVNAVISKRFAKKQQMQWSRTGAHLLLQTRTQTLDGSLRSTFRQWYPGMAIDNHEKPETARAG